MNKGLERKIEHYSHDKREYECFWGDGYRQDDNKSIIAYHYFDFFNADRGYGDMEIHMIDTLEIGDLLDISDPSGDHWVRRIA